MPPGPGCALQGSIQASRQSGLKQFLYCLKSGISQTLAHLKKLSHSAPTSVVRLAHVRFRTFDFAALFSRCEKVSGTICASTCRDTRPGIGFFEKQQDDRNLAEAAPGSLDARHVIARSRREMLRHAGEASLPDFPAVHAAPALKADRWEAWRIRLSHPKSRRPSHRSCRRRLRLER
jgi:hypothetical protein